MKAIRHLIFILVGLLLVGAFAGLAAAFWLAIGLTLAIAANKFTGVISAAADRSGPSSTTLPLIMIFTVLSFVLAAAFIVLLFFWYGWIPALSMAVLFFGYFGLREDRYQKATRTAGRVRLALVENVAKAAAGQITQRQLEERSRLTLEQSLPEQAYNLSSVYEALLDRQDLSSDQYRSYLELLEKHLSKVEQRHILLSKLHLEVRALLGLPARLTN